ncbi:hypothetical protein ACJX0J_012917, partial [Zea mays]
SFHVLLVPNAFVVCATFPLLLKEPIFFKEHLYLYILLWYLYLYILICFFFVIRQTI